MEGRVRSQVVDWRLKKEPWRAYRPELADFHHFDEEQDPDPHLSENWNRIFLLK